MKITGEERRRHDRAAILKPCKVYMPASGRFAPGRTCNVSAGGALVSVEGGRPMAAGEEINVTIAFSRMPVVPADQMLRGRVVRAGACEGGRQLVAVEFEKELAQLAA